MSEGRTALSPGRRVAGVLVLALLVALGILRSAAGTRLDSFTVDEPWHVVAGTAYVRTGDFHLNPEHPPLVKLWVGAAMPAIFRVEPKPLAEKPQERAWVEETMFRDNDSEAARQVARRAMWSLNGLLIFLVGLLLWRAVGFAAAAGTLAFLALEPTVGAHLPVVMTDLPLALTLALAIVSAAILAATWRWRWAAACGLAVGLALGAKHSAIPGLLGIFAVLVVAAGLGVRRGGAREGLRRLTRMLGAALLALFVLWSLYGFRFHAAPDGQDAFNRPMAEKIAELRLDGWRRGIAFADRLHLVPRAYLWGLADTVRTGVEGRGISEHFIWGRRYVGKAPWFSWPAILLVKLPLALSALTLLGVALSLLSFHRGSSRELPERWLLALLVASSGLHLVALVGSGAVWGGIRHATPILLAAALLGGLAVFAAWRRRSRIALAGVAALFVAAAATTLGEPRLWEYHNELVGGSANAWRYFGNEGLDLGQRFGEIRAFHDRVIAPTGLPLYFDYWIMEEQARAAHLDLRRRVENLDDTNVEGRYEGFFVYKMDDTLPWPAWDWDPKEVFRDLVLVERFGYVGIWKGIQIRPQTRASSLKNKVLDYIYEEKGDDWALVAKKLDEVFAQLPQSVTVGVELGNAYVRLGDGPRAVAAYRGLLEQKKVPLDDGVRADLEAQVAKIAAAPDAASVAKVGLIRNPWLE